MTKIHKENLNSTDKIEIVTSINPKGSIGDVKFNAIISALMLKTKSGWIFFPATPLTNGEIITREEYPIPVTQVTEKLASAPAPEEISPPSYNELLNQLHTPSPPPSTVATEIIIHHHHHTSRSRKKNTKVHFPKIKLFPSRDEITPL